MFERYTEKARRAIFFARYEASQYGSPAIESQHLLLGLLREDNSLSKRAPRERWRDHTFREEIDALTTRGERISTSVEMPLSAECRRILNKAAEEAERLGHKHIGTEHLLLGILAEEASLAARLLRERGLKADSLRQEKALSLDEKPAPMAQDVVSVSELLEAWSAGDAEAFSKMFATDGQFVDSHGDLWIGPEGILEAARLSFTAPGWAACQGKIEDVQFIGSRAVMVTLVWERDGKAEKPNPACVRMTVILIQKADGWAISRVQITALGQQSRTATG